MIGNDWDVMLKSVWESEGFKKFMNKVNTEYETHTCYPKYENIFKQHKYECVQNQVVLTNTSAKIIREYTKSNRFTYITGFIPVK